MNATVVSELETPPLWLGASTLRRLLSPEAVVAAVEEALRAAGPHAAGGHAALACDVEGGVFHVKATAMRAPRAVYVTKINANFPANPQRGLPTIQGVAALFDAANGRLLALLDSPELTASRTGAATAVAARRLARAEASRLLVCGAGRQAFSQVACLAAVRPLVGVWVHDLDSRRAAALADRLTSELGLVAEPVTAFAPVSRRADLIVTCTTARAPFLRVEDVAPGAFVAAVGADHPLKQEIAPALMAAARVFVDSPEQALACGELRHAVAAGTMRPDDVAGTLGDLVAGGGPGRTTDDEITLFDSTGIAIEDAATALAAFSRWGLETDPATP